MLNKARNRAILSLSFGWDFALKNFFSVLRHFVVTFHSCSPLRNNDVYFGVVGLFTQELLRDVCVRSGENIKYRIKSLHTLPVFLCPHIILFILYFQAVNEGNDFSVNFYDFEFIL